MFAHEERVFFQRRRAAVGQVIALRRRTDDDELAAERVAKAVCFTKQPLFVLPEQTFNRRPQKFWIVRREPPINVKIAGGIHGNHALNTVAAAQNNPPMRQINFCVRQIQLQFLCGKEDAHVPDAFVGKGFGSGRDAGREFVTGKISEFKIVFSINRNGHRIRGAGLR